MNTKRCPKCKQMLEAKKFASMDANCICKVCQRGGSAYAGETTVIAAQDVIVPGQSIIRTPRESKRPAQK